jgi:hypothetical protein
MTAEVRVEKKSRAMEIMAIIAQSCGGTLQTLAHK